MPTYSASKKIGLFFGPFLFLIIQFLPFEILSEKADTVIAIGAWMVSWWITEAVSISVTSLLPLLLFPLFKVMNIDDVGANYGSPIVFLFFGGFVLALAIEKVNLHRRIALTIIKKTGTTPNKVILGFMIATGFMSMWISNTACTVVMLPIAMSVISLLMNDADGFTKKDQNFALSIMLGIAFSASAGGIATVIGTPPNSVLIGLLENQYGIEVSFFQWMLIGLPVSVILIAIIYLVMVKWMFPSKGLAFNASKDVINEELLKLGKISAREKQVLIIFSVMVFLWVFRVPINSLVPSLGLSDTMISLFGALAFFTIPYNLKQGDFILNWNDTQKLSWGILILFGGGLALANGMSESAIIEMIATSISTSEISILFMAILLITLVLFMTELMSNVALTAVMAPVVAGIAIGLNIPMLHLLIPITLASSCAFMLPMATPPNAIVFASGYVKINQMARIGVILNLISAVLLILVFKFFMPLVF
jgi:sodium-dependent dicarboxylate transporter 2/3/5